MRYSITATKDATKRANENQRVATFSDDEMLQPWLDYYGRLYRPEGFYVSVVESGQVVIGYTPTNETPAHARPAPHCSYHEQFQYDCLECADALAVTP